MYTRARLMPAVVLSLVVLSGCVPAGDALSVAPSATQVTPSQPSSATPAPELPGSIVLGSAGWQILDGGDHVTSTLAYTEPVSVALERLIEILGDDYVLTEYLADDGCGQAPAHIYAWGDRAVTLRDHTDLTADAPYDVVPYTITSHVAQFNGLVITTPGNLSVGDDVSEQLAVELENGNGTGILMLEVGGSYARAFSDGTAVDAEWGLVALAANDIGSIDVLSSPARVLDFFC